MCLLIKKPASAKFTTDQLQNFYTNNPDGFGMMYAENGTLRIHRSIGNFASFLRAYKRIEDKELLIHFRQATHGDIHARNSHPYPVVVKQGYQLWLMHNGILAHGNDSEPSRSDTYCYIKEVLRPLLSAHPTIAFDQKFLDAIGDAIGSGNKFALADSEGNIGIVNESAGVTFNGSWLSNTYAWDWRKLAGNNFVKPSFVWTDYDEYGEDLYTKEDYLKDTYANRYLDSDNVVQWHSKRVDTRAKYQYKRTDIRSGLEPVDKTFAFEMPKLLLKGLNL